MAEASTLGRPHVFVVLGDVTRIECDAWLLPTDDRLHVTQAFRAPVGLDLHGEGRLSGVDWGGSSVLRWGRHADGHGPQIWLGRVGRAEGEWSDELAAVAAEFVTRAAEEARMAADGRYPVLALPAIGTGHGGAGSHKGELYRALLRTLAQASEEHEVDVVLVLEHERAYSAAQRARAHLLTSEQGGDPAALWDFATGERPRTLLDAAARLAGVVREGRLVQFVGAGASAGLWRRSGIPPWQGLLDAVAIDAGVEPALLGDLDLRDQATVLSHHLRLKEDSLPEALSRHLTRSHYTLAHGLLASLGTREHVTTNFDTMLENALRAADDHLAVLPYTAVEGQERWVLKLHGSVDRQGDAHDPMVITRDDYLAVPVRYGALYGIVQALLLTQHMLFVGYSLRDEDFHHLVHEVRAARGPGHRQKMGTVLSLFETPTFDILWPDLDVVPMVPARSHATDDAAATVAARRLLLFVDLVGHEAASLHRFLLDPDYEALLPDREADQSSDLRLRKALKALQATASGESGSGWDPVHRLLAEFGGNPSGLA